MAQARQKGGTNDINGVGDSAERIAKMVKGMDDITLFDFLKKQDRNPGPVTDTTRSLYQHIAVNALRNDGADLDLSDGDVRQNNLGANERGDEGSSGYDHSVTRFDDQELLYDDPVGHSAEKEPVNDFETASEASHSSSVVTVLESTDGKYSTPCRSTASAYRQPTSNFMESPPPQIGLSGVVQFSGAESKNIRKRVEPGSRAATYRSSALGSHEEPRTISKDQPPIKKARNDEISLFYYMTAVVYFVFILLAIILLLYILYLITTETADAKVEENELNNILDSL